MLVNLVAGYCAVTATQAKRAKKKGHNLLFLAMLRHSEMLVGACGVGLSSDEVNVV